MHSDAAALKPKSNESEIGKKNLHFFWTTFFLSILEAGVSVHILAQTAV